MISSDQFRWGKSVLLNIFPISWTHRCATSVRTFDDACGGSGATGAVCVFEGFGRAFWWRRGHRKTSCLAPVFRDSFGEITA